MLKHENVPNLWLIFRIFCRNIPLFWQNDQLRIRSERHRHHQTQLACSYGNHGGDAPLPPRRTASKWNRRMLYNGLWKNLWVSCFAGVFMCCLSDDVIGFSVSALLWPVCCYVIASPARIANHDWNRVNESNRIRENAWTFWAGYLPKLFM